VANQRKSRRDTPLKVASGIEELIGRLRDQGVMEGRNQSEQLVSEAKAKADTIVQQAQHRADAIVAKAQTDADNLKQAGQQALELAFRDTLLALKTQLANRFTGEVKRLVSEEQQKKEILEKMILEVAARVKADVDQSTEVEVLLPQKVVGLADLSQNPDELEKGILTHFVRLNSQSMLRDGVTFGFAKDQTGGLKIKLVDREIELDLSDQAVADAILVHLQPRFRALLEGVVK
jgi:V/A-type H+-transporting ATPase subunit E